MFFLLLFFIISFSSISETIVKGNTSISSEKIKMLIEPILNKNEAKKILFHTNLFSKVEISQKGEDVIVQVVEKIKISELFFVVNSETLSENDSITFTFDQLSNSIEFTKNLIIDEQLISEHKLKIKAYYTKKQYKDIKIKHKIEKDCNNEYKLIYEINVKNKFFIPDVVFHNNKKLSSSKLSNAILERSISYIFFNFSSPEPFLIEQSLDKIITYTKNQSFFNAKINSYFMEMKEKDQQIYISLNEGDEFNFGNVQITIADNLIPQTIDSDYSLTNKPAYYYKISQLLSNIKEKYAKSGQLVDVEYKEKIQNNIVDLNIHITPAAKKYIISKILIKGNDRTQNQIILEASKVTTGSYVDANMVSLIQQKIEMLGYFKSVNVSLVKNLETEDDSRVLLIKVEESKVGAIMAMGQGSMSFAGKNEAEGSITFQYDSPNFLGSGNFLSTELSSGSKGNNFKVSYKIPNFHNSNVDFESEFSFFTEHSSSQLIKEHLIYKHKDNNKSNIEKSSMVDDTCSFDYKIFNIGPSNSLIFDLLEYGFFFTELKIIGQKFDTKKFDDSKNIPKFYKKDLFFPKEERVLIESVSTHKISKLLDQNKSVTFINAITFSTDFNSGNLKYETKFNFLYFLNKNKDIIFKTNGSYGHIFSTDKHFWIDNFKSSSVKLMGIRNIGPIENNIFTEIGGTQKFNIYAELIFPFILPQEWGFNLFAGIYAGSLWNSKIEKGLVLDKYIKLRNWKDGTKDISSDEFSLRLSAAGGFRWQIFKTPFVFQCSLCLPICFDKDRDSLSQPIFDKYKDIGFEFQFTYV